MQSIVLGPGESRPIEGHAAEIKASTEDCDGRFAIFEATIGPDAGPPLHLHRRHLEAYYVVDGELEIRSGGGTIAAPAGSLALAPPASPHTFSNPGPEPARFFGFTAPGGLDHFLAGLGAIWGRPGPPDLQALGELMQRFDTAPVSGEPPDGPAATVVAPGEGDTLTIAGNTIVFKAEADDTGGAFGLVEYTAAPGFGGPPAHIHRETADNPGAEPARFLSLVSPGGFEQYFRDLAQTLGDGPVDGAAISKLVARYDFELVS